MLFFGCGKHPVQAIPVHWRSDAKGCPLCAAIAESERLVREATEREHKRAEGGIKSYRVQALHCVTEGGAYDESTFYENAWSAADALVQVTTRNTGRHGFKVLSIAPTETV